MQMIQESSADKRQSLYLYTDEDSYEPLARIDRNGNQEQHIYYFHTDLNGLPEELTDEAGEIVWECSYQLWGKPVQEIAHTQIQQNLRYQGQYLDRETGLHYNTFRYYDPDTGRFTMPDPIGLAGGYNMYQYAPNAFMWIDPLGLTADDIIRYKPRDSLSAQSGNRRTAITRAWAQEKALLQNGGKGTRAWTAEERALILNTPNSKLASVMSKAGYTGHHINSVEGNGSLGAKWKGDPRNIVFLQNGDHPSGINEHIHGPRGHRGTTRNPTNGRLIDRGATLRQRC